MNLWEYLDRRAERRAKRSPRKLMSFRDWLGVFLVTAFIGALFNLLKFNFPDKNEQLIVYMLGQLSGFVGAVVALHYTASKHDEQRADDASKMTDAVKDIASAAKATAEGPSGKAGDPVHTVEEKK